MGINHIWPLFTAPAIMDLAAVGVFGNPVFSLLLILVSSDSSSTPLDAHHFSVSLHDEMDVGDISPHGFSGLAMQVFDGILVGTVWWGWCRGANFLSVLSLAFYMVTGNFRAWSRLWILVQFWHHILHHADGGLWGSDRFAHSGQSHHVVEVNCCHCILFRVLIN